MWDTVKTLIGGAAPVLGSLVGGPVGSAAGDLIAKALGCDNTSESIETALASDPQALAKLKGAELEHKSKLADLAYQEKKLLAESDIEHRKISTADISDARDRDAAIMASGNTNTRANWMIVGDVIGLLGCLLTLFVADIGEAERTIIITFGSYFGLGLRDAHSFEFGSSRGSKEKDASAGFVTGVIKKLGKN